MDREMQIENIKKALELENNIKNSILKYTELDDNRLSNNEKAEPERKIKGMAALFLALISFLITVLLVGALEGTIDNSTIFIMFLFGAVLVPATILIITLVLCCNKTNRVNQETNTAEQEKTEYDIELETLGNEIQSMQKELAALYETEKPVPLQYRNRKALQYIYDIMSTSDYDLKQAIDSYDKFKARELEEERIAAIRDAADRQANAIGWAATMNYIKRN